MITPRAERAPDPEPSEDNASEDPKTPEEILYPIGGIMPLDHEDAVKMMEEATSHNPTELGA